MANSGICSIEGCAKPASACGMCSMHYARKRIHGDPLYVREYPKICSVADCGKPVSSRGLCRPHYCKETKPNCSIDGCKTKIWKGGFCKLHFRRKEKLGDPLAEPGPTPMQTFIQSAVACTDADCLIWPFAMSAEPYPKIHITINGKGVIAARHVCTLAHGDPPTPEHETAHSCGKGHLACMNASHLRWATKIENAADKLIHGTDVRGERSGTAVLDRDDVRAIRQSLESGESQYSVAKRYSVSRSCIANIATRRAWGWLE